MLARVRSFFEERGVLEVDTPLLSRTAPVDTFIDVMKVELLPGEIGYLHTSPEYAMKRLLAEGSGDIYQLSHVFRAGEKGWLHNPEFTMIEWYRLNLDYAAFIEETLDLIRLFLGPLPHELLSYREALKQFADCDAFLTPTEELVAIIQQQNFNMGADVAEWDRDTLLNALFSFLVEPHLGEDKLTVIIEYPSTQAALAKTALVGGANVARRFEIYAQGIELANGYDELTDAKEQRRRFEASNKQRLALGKEALPIDEAFLKALEKGMPDCRGVAVGFDRLLMLKLQASQLSDVMPFTW